MPLAALAALPASRATAQATGGAAGDPAPRNLTPPEFVDLRSSSCTPLMLAAHARWAILRAPAARLSAPCARSVVQTVP